jgi:hypothetical protein
MNEIRRKQYELEILADLIERIDNNVKWYQHTDEETGELVDDTGENDVLHLAALRNVRKSILKLAGV